MSQEHDRALSLAFMRGHPAQAARVLETLPVDEVAEIFERAPARLGAEVLAAMLPRHASRCLAALADTRVQELLTPMGTQATVAVLRHVPEPRRRTLIKGLPATAALASTLLLGYTEDTLGAWADPDVIALPADTRTADALARIRQAVAAHPMVFVTDAERRLVGCVAMTTLLRSNALAALATLMQPATAVLAAHAPLAGAAAHPGWESSSILPVVEPGERLVGVITRDALARALRRDAAAAVADESADVAALPVLLARGYWSSLSGLIESALPLLPRVPPLAPGPDGR